MPTTAKTIQELDPLFYYNAAYPASIRNEAGAQATVGDSVGTIRNIVNSDFYLTCGPTATSLLSDGVEYRGPFSIPAPHTTNGLTRGISNKYIAILCAKLFKDAFAGNSGKNNTLFTVDATGVAPTGAPGDRLACIVRTNVLSGLATDFFHLRTGDYAVVAGSEVTPGATIPELTSNSGTAFNGGAVTMSASSIINTNEDAWYATKINSSNGYTSAGQGSNYWIQAQYAIPIVPTGIVVAGRKNNWGTPGTWQVLGSNNGTDWTVLLDKSDGSSPLRNHRNDYHIPLTFAINNTTAYSYIRLLVLAKTTDSDVNGGVGYFQPLVGKRRFNHPLTIPTLTAASGTAYVGGTVTMSASSEYDGSHQAWRASYTSSDWATAGVTSNFWIQAQFTNPQVFKGVLVEGRGGGTESPLTWRIEGSNDGVVWTTLLDKTSGTDPISTRRTYLFSNSTAYNRIRLYALTGNGSNPGLSIFQPLVGEVEETSIYGLVRNGTSADFRVNGERVVTVAMAEPARQVGGVALGADSMSYEQSNLSWQSNTHLVMRSLAFIETNSSDLLQDYTTRSEGIVAWDNNLQTYLPPTHPYFSVDPRGDGTVVPSEGIGGRLPLRTGRFTPASTFNGEVPSRSASFAGAQGGWGSIGATYKVASGGIYAQVPLFGNLSAVRAPYLGGATVSDIVLANLGAKRTNFTGGVTGTPGTVASFFGYLPAKSGFFRASPYSVKGALPSRDGQISAHATTLGGVGGSFKLRRGNLIGTPGALLKVGGGFTARYGNIRSDVGNIGNIGGVEAHRRAKFIGKVFIVGSISATRPMYYT